MVAAKLTISGGGGAVVNGVQVCAKVAGVGVGSGACIGGNPTNGWFELKKGAIKDRKRWPSPGVDAEIVIESGGFFMHLTQ